MANNYNRPTWPGWETVRLIGRGSFGAVYEIERDVFGHREKAAMKVISIPQSDSDIEELYDSGYDEASVTATFKSHLERIVNEYSLMREMNGAANVVNCDDFRLLPHDDGIGWDIFIKMELLTPLTKTLDSNPSDEQVIRIAKDMCNALILCRKYGIIHRDIKPQNIFVSKNGDYKLGDFGIAKTIEKTSGGTKIGTYKYMAPEVYNNQPYNHTADIYSLGLVLHWLLNERRSPFMPLPPAPAVAMEEDEARAKRFSGTPVPAPAHGSEELQRIVLKACAYDPKGRCQSAEEMLHELEALSGKAEEQAPVTPAVSPADRKEETDGGTVGAFGAVAAQQEARGTEEEDEGTGSVTVGAFGRKDEPPAPPPRPRKWPAVLGVVGGMLALLVIGFFTIHSWNPATCTEPETCKICGRTRGEALGHQYTDATCLEPAVCTVCGDVSTGAIGHDWGEPEYTWSADNSSVTAKRVCKNDPTHVESENVKTSSEVTAAASCTENGTTTYTATFTNSAFGTQKKAAEDIAAVGHQWSAATHETPKTCLRCGFKEGEPIPSVIELACGGFASIGLREDGTVLATSSIKNIINRSDWKDIISVAGGYFQYLGLKSDGTVVAVTTNDSYGRCDVGGWRDIVEISAGDEHSVGLRSDGTVVAVGRNQYGQCNVSEWKNVKQIAAGYYHTVALFSNGTVKCIGSNSAGQCKTDDWTDIVAIAAGGEHTIGLRSNGTVVAVGRNSEGQCKVSDWTYITAIACGCNHTLGLRSDGTVLAVGENKQGQCDVDLWKDIVTIDAGYMHSLGVQKNGQVVAAGEKTDGRCMVSDW